MLTGKTTLSRASLGVEHWVYGGQTARTEAIVVALVATGCSGEHYEIAVLASWSTLLRIVLKIKKKKKNKMLDVSFFWRYYNYFV